MGNQKEEEKPLIPSTIHHAKGLEWRVIFIPMLCEDYIPSSRVVDDLYAYEEERRVIYVAITRTKDQLYLIPLVIVQMFRGHQSVRLSQFVSKINPKVYKISSAQFKLVKKQNYNGNFKSAQDLLPN